MRGDIPLQSFEVEGFRAIRHLLLPELGRVNLFVGQNNAGKTSLLEAIRLYLHRNEPSLARVLFEILRDHSAYRPSAFSRQLPEPQVDELEAAADAVEALFYGSFGEEIVGSIRLRQEATALKRLTIRLPWIKATAPDSAERDEIARVLFLAPNTAILEMESEVISTEFPLEWFVRRVPISRSGPRDPALIIPPTGMEPFRTREMWDRLVVSGQEGMVEDALRTIVPNLERVLVVGESGRRAVLLKLKGYERPIPIQSMGDGVNRVFAIAIALVLAQGGALLLDEVENGLHFTVQDEIWQAIFLLSTRFDVQVFATSHSWDSVVGFQYAANLAEAEGVLYRLDAQPNGLVEAVRYTEREVEIAAEQRIEVR
jgi:ABC-type branched-subunit amino acid transport system ATPase component